MRAIRRTTGIALATLAAVAVTTGSAVAYSASTEGGGCQGNGTQSMSDTGRGIGGGMGLGKGIGRGAGQDESRGGMGMSDGSITASSGELTDAQRAMLLSMADEEKLAHDVYVTLGDRFPEVTQFDRIAQSETKHLEAVRNLLDRYGIDDPTVGLAVGDFSDPAFDALYKQLVDSATSADSARAVGVTIEKKDIADLEQAMSNVAAPDVLQVLTNLKNASEHHLRAFGG